MRSAIDFVLLAAVWGASFIFMRVAAPEFGPFALMLVRCAIGVAILLPLLAWQRGLPALRAYALPLAVVGLFSSAVPFALLGFAALHLQAGVLAILNATAPFWAALVALLWFGDSLARSQMIGIAVGFAGVVVLVLGREAVGTPGDAAMLALGAALASTFCYGIATNFTRRFLSGCPALANATGSQLSATGALLVPGLLTWPQTAPGPAAWGATLVLGAVCTGLAYVLYFRLIRDIGATRTIAVTFVIPLFGMAWGVLFLAEKITLGILAGGLVIVLGTVLTTGAWRHLRRSPSLPGV